MRDNIAQMILLGLIGLIILAGIISSCAQAEEDEELPEGTERIWVMCMPDSYVTIRRGPSKNSPGESRGYAGDSFLTDGKRKGQFLHLIEVPNEMGEGWIATKYITGYEPQIYENGETFQVNVKEVNCRKCIGGGRRGVLKRDAEVTVYLMALDWSVTNKGYIQSKYLR